MFHYLLVSEHFLNVSFVELTHEFLQILEKTPSRLKRIRNWRVRIIADKLIPLTLPVNMPELDMCLRFGISLFLTVIVTW